LIPFFIFLAHSEELICGRVNKNKLYEFLSLIPSQKSCNQTIKFIRFFGVQPVPGALDGFDIGFWKASVYPVKIIILYIFGIATTDEQCWLFKKLI